MRDEARFDDRDGVDLRDRYVYISPVEARRRNLRIDALLRNRYAG